MPIKVRISAMATEAFAEFPDVLNDAVAIDRSLDSARFRRATGYAPDNWTGLVRDMYNDYLSCPYYRTYDDIEQRKGSVKR